MSQPFMPERGPLHAGSEMPWPTGRAPAQAGTASPRCAARSAAGSLPCNAVAYRHDRGDLGNGAVPSGTVRTRRAGPVEASR